MVLIIDPQVAGVSGDMILCSLINLGADEKKIIDEIKKSEKYFPDSSITKIEFQKTQKHGISSTQLVLDIDENIQSRKGSEIKKAIVDSTNTINFSDKAKSFVKSCIDTLITSEARVHDISEHSVHFHEASSIDTFVDIVGVAIALDDLGLFDEKILCLPICVGSGTVSFSHGTMSNPASAVLEIFKNSNLLIQGKNVDQELTTPTGACILANLTNTSITHYPSVKICSIGYGAGQKNFEGFSNVLKIVRGSENDSVSDYVKILETNVDDVSGEILGNLIDKLMKKGAKDVSIFQGITKKGRPTNLISVICDDEYVDTLSEILVFETGTLGIRISTSERFVIPRSLHKTNIIFNGKSFEINYKKSFFRGQSNFKIEFDDLINMSKITNKSIRETELILRKQINIVEDSND